MTFKNNNITYNHLNLPVAIHFANTNKIEYTYDANGTKLKKEVHDNTGINVTDYLNGFQYSQFKISTKHKNIYSTEMYLISDIYNLQAEINKYHPIN